MSEHRDRIAIPNHTQETNINEYKEDGAIRGTSCRKDRTEPFHHILANEKYKCLYIGIQEKLSFFLKIDVTVLLVSEKRKTEKTRKQSRGETRITIRNLVDRCLIISMISERRGSNQFEI